MTGYALSASAISGILQGCKADKEPDWVPEFFTQDQFNMIGDMADIILPTTDTPGAKDVLVDRFIDKMVKECMEKEDQDRFLAGLNEMADADGTAFGELSDEQKYELVAKADADLRERAENPQPGPPPFFGAFKQMVLLGYFTSEEVGENVMAYDPMPGAYNGCVPLEEGQRIWTPAR